VAQVSLIVLGYGAALFPYLVVPDFTIESTAAPRITHVLVLWTLGAGAFLLVPSLFFLMRVFKGKRTFALLEEK
jgi:cytochrome d ubiquinol oxidase subunit II